MQAENKYIPIAPTFLIIIFIIIIIILSVSFIDVVSSV